ncbi:hypothetical protein LIER_16998 [Lithospermum erythrorhizon]|uniref:Retrovirus-related Pol polyprotein from transposon TNT 1-94 n=1 Tax=Lithospermum erythrorhizon TaxID=34254 RepID=A0AAV3Q8R7_LITER
MQKIPYASIGGSLMYAQICTRSDIEFIVGVMGRCLSNPRMDHWKAVKRVIRVHSLPPSNSSGGMVRNFVAGLRVVNGIKRPLKIYCANRAAVLYSNNNKSSTKSKHIERKFLIVTERIQSGTISIEHI